MAYQFSNQQKASANVYRDALKQTKYKIAGINGEQTSADNMKVAIDGLLTILGMTTVHGLERAITQDVEEAP